MFTIAFISFERSNSNPCEAVSSSLIRFLNKQIGREKYRIIRYQGPRNPTTISIYLADYIKNVKADIIISLGYLTTKIAIDLIEKQSTRTSIVCWGFFEVVGNHSSYHTKVTGICTGDILTMKPVQSILRIQPNISKLIIPFRLSSRRGETAKKLRQLQQVFAKSGIFADIIPIKSDEKIESIRNNISEISAIIATEASVCYEEFEIIENIAHRSGTLSWIGVEYGEKRHSLLSVINDFEAVGKALGRQIYRALHGEEPSVKKIKNFRELRVNMRLAAEKGIPITKRLEQQLSQSLESYEDQITVFSLVVNPSPQAFLRDLFTTTTHHMRLSNDAHFHHQTSENWPINNIYHVKENLYHIASMSYAKAVIVTGDKYAYTICKHFKDNDINRPIIYFTNTNEDQSPYNWHNKYSTPEMPIVRISIPPPNLRDQAKLLLAAAPHLRQVCLLVRYDSFSQIPLRLQSDIAQWQSFCMKRNVMPTIRYSPHEKYLEQIPTGVFTKDSGWIVCAENIPYSVMRQMGEWFIQHNVPAVSGSLTWARWFPLTIGIDADAIAEHKLMPVLKRILLEKQSPERDGSPVELRITNDISLEYEQWYRACINEEVAAQLGLDVNAAKTAVKDYKIVPVDYALDTAICMKQFTVEERLAMLGTPAPLPEVAEEASTNP